MKKIYQISILFFLLLFSSQVLALDPEQFIKGTIETTLDIAKIAAGIIIIIGGYFMITSTGDPHKFETGKKTLLYGGIGLLLILIADKLAEEIMGIIG